jgi:hypothetical protein
MNIFLAKSWRWNDNDIRFALDQHTYSWMFIMLDYWNKSRRVDTSLY